MAPARLRLAGSCEGMENPAQIRDLILERVRRSRGTGIGELPGEERAGTMWRPELVRLLEEIRDEARALAAASARGEGWRGRCQWT